MMLGYDATAWRIPQGGMTIIAESIPGLTDNTIVHTRRITFSNELMSRTPWKVQCPIKDGAGPFQLKTITYCKTSYQ